METPRTKAIPTAELLNIPTPTQLKAEIRRPQVLNPFEVIQMHNLFVKYYENHPIQKFQEDLFEKNHVILLRNRRDHSIQGFSTLLKVSLQTPQGPVTGIYSGDTVVAKEYWGSPALGMAFLKYLWLEKVRQPLRPVYWFLISKGYKTYLLMANNFKSHYPRFERETPIYFQNLMDQFYGTRFRNTYRRELNLIVPEGPTCHLKEHIADITPALRKLPRVSFFEKKNPDWRNGAELTCLAEMTLFMPLKYSLKKFIKTVFG